MRKPAAHARTHTAGTFSLTFENGALAGTAAHACERHGRVSITPPSTHQSCLAHRARSAGRSTATCLQGKVHQGEQMMIALWQSNVCRSSVGGKTFLTQTAGASCATLACTSLHHTQVGCWARTVLQFVSFEAVLALDCIADG